MKRKTNLVGKKFYFLEQNEITDRPVKTILKVMRFADGEKKAYVCKMKKAKEDVKRIIVDRKQCEKIFLPIWPVEIKKTKSKKKTKKLEVV